MSQIWALHDSDPKSHPMTRINLEQAKNFNARGYGIFQTVNEFRGPRRIENLVRINAWAVDMDDGTKAKMVARLQLGLIPTLVVETKRGYQAYWAAKDAKPEHWNAIVADRLVPYYGADTKARDLARILRRPGFMHLKDPANPFLVTKVWEWPVSYSEMQMASFYPDAKVEKQADIEREVVARAVPVVGGFWERVWTLNCEEALCRLSGHAAVKGETYSFRPNVTGTKNIWVDGKSTSCWIDRNGRIGSFDKGGPSIFSWLKWYGLSPSRAVDVIKEVFPECQPS